MVFRVVVLYIMVVILRTVYEFEICISKINTLLQLQATPEENRNTTSYKNVHVFLFLFSSSFFRSHCTTVFNPRCQAVYRQNVYTPKPWCSRNAYTERRGMKYIRTDKKYLLKNSTCPLWLLLFKSTTEIHL